jgi:hypothetical protein
MKRGPDAGRGASVAKAFCGSALFGLHPHHNAHGPKG